MEISPSSISACMCGDAYGVNLKGGHVLEETYDLKCPFSFCTLHASAGIIRKLCTSKTLCQDDA